MLFLLTFLFKGFHFPGRLVILAIVPIFIVMINSLYVRDKSDFGKFANLYTGLLYISVPVALTNFAVFNGNAEFDGMLLLSFFIIIWASDVGGYLFGITLGKVFPKKLFSEVSPKKSWAGFWGGMFLSAASGVVLHYVGMLDY
ncbi:phosphatidate cytidylyltransferase, partial [gut metagenome]